MRHRRRVSSWKFRLLASLGLLPVFASCDTKTDVTCGHEPVLAMGMPSGWEKCSDGVTHRVAIVACQAIAPRAGQTCATTQPGGSTTVDSCHADEDCTERANGRCDAVGTTPCRCTYGCVADSDCMTFGGHPICVCDNDRGHCARGSCTSDADCASGLCTLSPGSDERAIGCVSPDNECEVSADCSSGICEVTSQSTFSDPTDTRVCYTRQLSCDGSGRPFLVGGAARTAALAAREGWTSGEAPSVAGLSAEDREAIGQRWARAGLLEHASIAAFARFTLELLSLGAPAGLIDAAQAAMADETAHARACFALASAYLGRATGPGRLEIRGALDASSSRKILVNAILEGCIGETVAAIEAAEAADRATDPVVRRALLTISTDETRHAELSFRFVAWALGEDASLLPVAMRTFAGAAFGARGGEREREGGEGSLLSGSRDLSAHGLLSEAERRALSRQVIAEVVAPCAQALLERAARPEGAGLSSQRGTAMVC